MGDGRFHDKVLLVTGGSQGIGEAAARQAAREGARVLIASRSPDKGERVVAGIREAGGEAEFFGCDIRDSNAVRDMIEFCVDTFGGLDLAFNNAGVFQQELAPLGELSDEAWHAVLDTNLDGTMHCCREELRVMVAQGRGGAIVINGSVTSVIGTTSSPAYVASKHALAGLTKSMALDYAMHGIRVNCIGPGSTKTPMFDASVLAVQRRRELLAQRGEEDTGVHKFENAQRRTLTADEQAAVALFLLSDAASAMTGAITLTDGGMSIY